MGEKSRIHRIGVETQPARGSVIFVHGLGGDPFATWRNGGDDKFWPQWLADDRPDLAVFALEYPAAASSWQGGGMALPDRASNVAAALVADRLEEGPIVFICHSLGGLVVKQVLRLASDQKSGPASRLLAQTQGIVFIATPNTGSDVATWMDRFRVLLAPTVAAKDLLADSPYLRDLNFWYRETAPREDIATLVFAEGERTKGVAVVDQASSDPGIPGVRPIPLDADHFDICKPDAREAILYKSVLRFVQDRLPRRDTTKDQTPTDTGRRIFISYRRRATDDAALATFLKEQLSAAGHDVFIDVTMELGVDWSQEIARRIEWCEFLIVLLSKSSIESDMMQEEVRLASQRRSKGNSPVILPIRVNYEGELGYSLGAHLNRYQHVLWRGAGSNETLLPQIERVLSSDNPSVAEPRSVLSPAGADGAMPATARQRPASAADPRLLRRRPGGAAPTDDPCYIEREADRIALPLAEDLGVTLTIKAARQMGKTSLLVRYLDQCRKAGKNIVFIDFQSFSDLDLESQGSLGTRIAAQTLRDLGIDPQAVKLSQGVPDLTDFFEDVVFPRHAAPITIAFDEVDRVTSKPYRDGFFAVLRSWHNRRASHGHKGWERLDLVLVVASEPSFLIQDSDQSPFNVSDPIRLESFSREHVDVLNAIFNDPVGKEQLDDLHNLLNGHPYLTRLAFYWLGPANRMDFAVFMRRASEDDGPFGDHLRVKLSQLHRRPELEAAMVALIRSNKAPVESAYYRLQAAGLVTRGKDGRIVPANLLYRLFLDRILP